ncbi:hypothetical protein [Phytoactinopolyspora halophila]|uniref:hypothetical protein n=1 Tax=Phytoactinopolyspora halophila TaxID=1981511 RepID=UPI000F4EABCD|nr:hypothetical protein [Phytoactinopolyspora halophila]
MVDHNYSSVAVPATLTADIDAADTTLSVDSATGYPSTPFTVVLAEDTPEEEIVTVTSTSGTTWTVDREQDGSAALPHTAGTAVRHKVTARDLQWSRLHEESSTQVHGLTSGTVVGTSQSATLTNKSMSGNSNSFSNIPQSAVNGLIDLQALNDRAHTPLGFRVFYKETGNYYGGGDWLRITNWIDSSISPGVDGGLTYGIDEGGGTLRVSTSSTSPGRGIYSIGAIVTGRVNSGNTGILYMRIRRQTQSGSIVILGRDRYQKTTTGTYDANVQVDVPCVLLDPGDFVYVDISHTFGGGLGIDAAPAGANRFSMTLLRPVP